jgi:hypothetical protein
MIPENMALMGGWYGGKFSKIKMKAQEVLTGARAQRRSGATGRRKWRNGTKAQRRNGK